MSIGMSNREMSVLTSEATHIVHARQVDLTMSVIFETLLEFGDRLAEFHISEVDSASRHVAISQMAMRSCPKLRP